MKTYHLAKRKKDSDDFNACEYVLCSGHTSLGGALEHAKKAFPHEYDCIRIEEVVSIKDAIRLVKLKKL